MTLTDVCNTVVMTVRRTHVTVIAAITAVVPIAGVVSGSSTTTAVQLMTAQRSRVDVADIDAWAAHSMRMKTATGMATA